MFNHAYTIDIRNLIERVVELECAIDDYTEKMDDWQVNADNQDELETILSAMDELKGQGRDEHWRGAWYPLTLIHENYFVEAMQELLEDIGDIPHPFPHYIVIDWEATADNLRADYSSIEIDGHTYWFC